MNSKKINLESHLKWFEMIQNWNDQEAQEIYNNFPKSSDLVKTVMKIDTLINGKLKNILEEVLFTDTETIKHLESKGLNPVNFYYGTGHQKEEIKKVIANRITGKNIEE